jgi:hypothetical protein
MSDRSYKRSWKNLLINKSYQLRFTLFMVILSAVLILVLGIWVMRVANETTEVSKTSVRGTPCKKIPALVEDKDDAEAAPTPPPMKLPEEGAKQPQDAPVAANTGSGSDDLDDEGKPRRRAVVTIEQSTMEMAPEPKPQPAAVPADWGTSVVQHWACEISLQNKIAELESNRLRILFVLIATGLLLVFGLGAYGIKMTHRVAGPLFKVGLYLAKMREGRLDKVYNLRKGDQLLEFYEHFKHAHAGVVKMEKEDIERIKVVIAAAEASGKSKDPLVEQLRGVLARKEKSLE